VGAFERERGGVGRAEDLQVGDQPGHPRDLLLQGGERFAGGFDHADPQPFYLRAQDRQGGAQLVGHLRGETLPQLFLPLGRLSQGVDRVARAANAAFTTSAVMPAAAIATTANAAPSRNANDRASGTRPAEPGPGLGPLSRWEAAAGMAVGRAGR
jgi:hypothetical protein